MTLNDEILLLSVGVYREGVEFYSSIRNALNTLLQFFMMKDWQRANFDWLGGF